VETIVISVISMLSDPTDESPANLDAAKMLREDYPTYKKKVAKCVQRSLEE
jgi:ubiquitin-conjugating enzyme E2 G1